MSVVLPDPVAPTMPDALARPHLERHVLQHPLRLGALAALVVGKPDVVEHDVPARRARHGDRLRRATRSRTGSSSSLKIRSDDAIADCRTLNFSDMSLIGRKKRCEYCRNATSAPSVSVPAEHAGAAVPDDQRRGQRADRFDRRIEHRVVEDRIDVGVAVLAIDLVELSRSSARSRRNSCTVDMPVMFSCRNALIRAIRPRTTRYDSRTLRAEPLRDERDERQHREGDEREPPVHPQHHDHDADQREDVAEDGDDAGGEQIVQHVHVGGDARHQAADRVAVVVAQIQPLQVPVDRHPQVEHDPLPGQLHRPRLDVLGGERRRRGRRRTRSARRAQPVEPPGGDVLVDGDLHQVRLRERRRRRRR